MTQRENIYDVVARESARHGMPRERLLIETLRAVVRDELPVDFGGVALDIRLPQSGLTLRQGIEGAILAIERNPGFYVHWFKTITVDIQQFGKWLRSVNSLPPGPKRDETGYAEADKQLFPKMRRLIKEKSLRSPYAAALKLAEEGKVAGSGTFESRAKRLASRFRKERHGPLA